MKWFLLAILLIAALILTNWIRRKRAGTVEGKIAGGIFISLWRMVRKLVPWGKGRGV